MDNITKNKASNEDLAKARKELEILYEVSNAMRTTLELTNILHIILTGVTAHTGLGFNRALLFLVNDKERCLEPKMAIGPESGEHAQKIWGYISSTKPDMEDLIEEDRVEQNIAQSALFKSIKDLRVPLNEGNNLLAQAFQEGQPIHLQNNHLHQYTNDPLLKVFKTNEIIIMPLKAKDKVNGLIVADNLFTQKPITEDDLKMLTMLANQAGLAIENSQLYELVMHKSHTDSITGLWNHGFFQNQLSIETENAQVYKQPLSLMIMDIDNFKKLNDTYGHQNGDIVLKELANLLKESSRTNDYACRYGGEEFSVVLTNTSKDQAFTIAERLRQRIENYNFQKFSSTQNLKITMSIGIATFPQDAKSKEELINQADKSMYIAKFGGKNQTCMANPA